MPKKDQIWLSPRIRSTLPLYNIKSYRQITIILPPYKLSLNLPQINVWILQIGWKTNELRIKNVGAAYAAPRKRRPAGRVPPVNRHLTSQRQRQMAPAAVLTSQRQRLVGFSQTLSCHRCSGRVYFLADTRLWDFCTFWRLLSFRDNSRESCIFSLSQDACFQYIIASTCIV